MNYTAIFRLGLALLFACYLAACSGQSESGKCGLNGDNLLIDPQFATFNAPYRDRRWHASEHRAKKSFKYSVENTALVIERVGVEPWAIVTQIADAQALAGKKVQFSAELKLNLSPPTRGPASEPGGGLLLSAKRHGRTLLHSTMDHEPHMGVSDWVTVDVVTTIPPRTDSLEVGFVHQAAGTIAIRNPSLREVDASTADCAGS